MILEAHEAKLLSVTETIDHFQTDESFGITSEEFSNRLKRFGENSPQEEENESLLMKYLDQFKDSMILLLLGSAAVSCLVGAFSDAVSILLAVIIVSTVAFIQEYRSDQAIEKLKSLVSHRCQVVRNGQKLTIKATEVVPGDLVLLNSGERVPADIRLIESNAIRIDESIFTGEPKPAKKTVHRIDKAGNDADESENVNVEREARNTRLQRAQKFAAKKLEEANDTNTNDKKDLFQSAHNIIDCRNIAFQGTLVTTGNGKGIVCATGENTELGKIHAILSNINEKQTPLQDAMDELAKQITILSFIIIGIIFVIGVLTGKNWLDMFTMGISLAVAAIPEGLPIVVTVTLAMGVMRMANRNVIIRKLPSVESLGAVNVVCVDKTGTLTEKAMTVSRVFTPVDSNNYISVTGVGYRPKGSFYRCSLSNMQPSTSKNDMVDVHQPGEEAIHKTIEIGSVCNNTTLRADFQIIGQPTEGSLITLAAKAGVSFNNFERLSEVPFDSAIKVMSVEVKNTNRPGPPMHYYKGAAEVILDMCQQYYVDEMNTKPIDDSMRNHINMVITKFANESLRVLAMAYGPDKQNLIFTGLVGIYDPPRQGVKESIASLHAAGVNVIMITGDSKITACAIGRELGIIKAGEEHLAITGDQLNDEALVAKSHIFYRSTPLHKMKIVETLQHRGLLVAMTGDGVNDAPALKLSNIGISMGESGTDVAKEASHMVLMDDQFSTILNAIEEGKSIYNNIKNFLRYQLTTSISCMGIIIYCTILSFPLPLNPMQILWVNIIMDGPPAQSLGVEPVDPEVMDQPPRDRSKNIISPRMIFSIVINAIVMMIGTLYVYTKEKNMDGIVTPRDTSMVFTTFVFFQIFNALNCRSEVKSAFQSGLFSNKALLWSIGGCLFGQLAMIYLPFMRFIFDTEPLSVADWMLILPLTSTVWIIEEGIKFVVRSNK
mmetsp:Transcript_6989/g.10245  ORF Transcript_6989/g.10245 Transcript_6989/m.10245 type:complete len:945 (-) Transcript_6989:2690-5524(-)